MASVAGTLGGFGQASYSTTKAGLIGLTKTLALEGARHGITANAIVPGIIGTEAFHFGNPEMNERMVKRTALRRAGEPRRHRQRDRLPLLGPRRVHHGRRAERVRRASSSSRFEALGRDRRRDRPAGRVGRRRGTSPSRSRAAARSASPSTPPTGTLPSPACASRGSGGRGTPARRGRTSSCRSRASSRSRSPPPTARSTPAASRAALFRSDDGGDSWRALDALLDLPSRPTWSFPPRPWTSHVRWIAPSPHDADLLLVGIELGGLMRSTDGGETWQDHRPGAQPDVHSLAWHPRERGRAYEAGGGGSAWSDDGGETWHPADDGRDRNYTWSVAPDPTDPDVWFVSASTGPVRRARRARRPGTDLPARGRPALGRGRRPGTRDAVRTRVRAGRPTLRGALGRAHSRG